MKKIEKYATRFCQFRFAEADRRHESGYRLDSSRAHLHHRKITGLMTSIRLNEFLEMKTHWATLQRDGEIGNFTGAGTSQSTTNGKTYDTDELHLVILE